MLKFNIAAVHISIQVLVNVLIEVRNISRALQNTNVEAITAF